MSSRAPSSPVASPSPSVQSSPIVFSSPPPPSSLASPSPQASIPSDRCETDSVSDACSTRSGSPSLEEADSASETHVRKKMNTGIEPMSDTAAQRSTSCDGSESDATSSDSDAGESLESDSETEHAEQFASVAAQSWPGIEEHAKACHLKGCHVCLFFRNKFEWSLKFSYEDLTTKQQIPWVACSPTGKASFHY